MPEDIIYPTKEKVYLIGTNQYCFRSGQPAEIVGVKMGKPDTDSEPRLGYEIEFSDGITDIVPVSEIGLNYELLTFSDIIKQKYKK